MHYAKSTGGYYDAAFHGDDIPADAVEITEQYHAELLQAQSDGKQIIADESGYPIAIDQPLPVRTKNTLLAEVANKRWQVETGGIVVRDTPIATDRESQSQLNSAYTSLKNGLTHDTPWKSADGSFKLVQLAELETVAQAVATHVRTCFATEQAHVEAINMLQTQAERDAYDIHSGWPSAS